MKLNDYLRDWIEPEAVEFDCPGCGRQIIALGMFKMHPPLCGACLNTPYWTMWPDMVKALDPFNDRKRELATMTFAEVECRSEWFHAAIKHLQVTGKTYEKVRIIEDEDDDGLTQKWIH